MDEHPQPTKTIIPHARVEEAKDLLARAKPAAFVREFITKLQEDGNAVIARLFAIATDETVSPGTALKAIDQILRLTNVEGIVRVALGLQRQVGRPGGDAEKEAEKQAQEWADIIDLDERPPGSGHFEAEEKGDAEA